MDTTEDFVIVASYFDQSDFTANFKKINPEKGKAFKKLMKKWHLDRDKNKKS